MDARVVFLFVFVVVEGSVLASAEPADLRLIRSAAELAQTEHEPPDTASPACLHMATFAMGWALTKWLKQGSRPSRRCSFKVYAAEIALEPASSTATHFSSVQDLELRSPCKGQREGLGLAEELESPSLYASESESSWSETPLPPSPPSPSLVDSPLPVSVPEGETPHLPSMASTNLITRANVYSLLMLRGLEACLAIRMASSQAPELPAWHRTCFHGRKACSIGLFASLLRLHRAFHCSDECFIIALLYADRVGNIEPRAAVSERTWHRLLVVSLVLALKFHDDYKPYSNTYYAKIGGLCVTELNNMEKQLCKLLDWKFFVQIEEYRCYRDLVYKGAGTHLARPKVSSLDVQLVDP
jgi:hypothetical protein